MIGFLHIQLLFYILDPFLFLVKKYFRLCLVGLFIIINLRRSHEGLSGAQIIRLFIVSAILTFISNDLTPYIIINIRHDAYDNHCRFGRCFVFTPRKSIFIITYLYLSFNLFFILVFNKFCIYPLIYNFYMKFNY